ncbi:MAG: hypothetical protein ACRDZQ_00755 [Acidimicrobiales bacterium]
MLIVGTEEAVVEQELIAGLLACPTCPGVLGPCGHARWRVLRRRGGEEERFRPRRAKCRAHACKKTQVLLPDDTLIRRRDEVAVIGQALEAKVGGNSNDKIAAALGLSMEIVRGWVRRFARDAEAIRAHFTRWAHALGPSLGPIKAAGDAFSDAMEAIGVAARANVQRFGPRPVWSIASVMSGGALLCHCHTSFPFPPVP